MEGLQKKLGYAFYDCTLLETAMNHSSYANEHRNEGIESNERLEFLGSRFLYRRRTCARKCCRARHGYPPFPSVLRL